jgi:hypothetical protein
VAEEFPYRLSKHARRRIEQRGIQLDWIRRTLAHPDRTEPDPEDQEANHAIKRFHALGDAVLRVVYNPAVSPYRVITAFFDRKGRTSR